MTGPFLRLHFLCSMFKQLGLGGGEKSGDFHEGVFQKSNVKMESPCLPGEAEGASDCEVQAKK